MRIYLIWPSLYQKKTDIYKEIQNKFQDTILTAFAKLRMDVGWRINISMSWGNKNFITPLRLLQAASERTTQLPFIPRFVNVYTSSKLEYM